MADDKINPMGLLYDDFEVILNNITIKYYVKAEQYETTETVMAADQYLAVINGTDNFFSYTDYTLMDYLSVGWNDKDTIKEVIDTQNIDLVPEVYRSKLLDIRRKKVLDTFEEQNNYYRMLNGYPDVEDSDYYYVTSEIHEKYDIPVDVPVHKLQDYGNKISDGLGDLYISIVEGCGYLETLIDLHPDKEYLKYVGSDRISIKTSREALNFQCIQLNQSSLSHALYEQFLIKYEQCREYFVKTVYTKEYRTFLDYYDNFIAMCIMVMTVQQINASQLLSAVKRQFFSIYGVRALYQAYNVPFDLSIDEDTQSQLVQNLNLLVLNKSTNKVLYNLAYLLGFTNINIYKYYLGKERKFDLFGAPIVAYKDKFNTDTGEMETVPDYETMYNIYFQKEELRNDDLINTFNRKNNTVSYDEVIEKDPMWWNDDKLYKMLWETEYNFVETKYLGIGVAYSMTDILFENVFLLKFLLTDKETTDVISVTLPKITESLTVPLYDLIIYLICLTAASHKLTGEIITIPTQVISVIDYMRNVEEEGYLVDTLGFDFKYFDPANTENRKDIESLKAIISEKEYDDLMKIVNNLAFSETGAVDNYSRVKKLNSLYNDAKTLYKFLTFQMSKCHDIETYRKLKTMTKAIYFSKELRSVFTIKGTYSDTERTAWTYFEYLYHANPALYSTLFEVNTEELYHEYVEEHSLDPSEFTYEDYMIQVELGEIKIDYFKFRPEVEEEKDTLLYTYINHCIDRLSNIIEKLNLIYLINGTSTPLADLLAKLIRFFKSYTVDLISFETTYVLDLKPANVIRLLDEFDKIIKINEIKDNININHSDVITSIISNGILPFDKISFEEKMLLLALYELDDKSLIKLKDTLNSKTKVLGIDDEYLKALFDTVLIKSDARIDSRVNIHDSIKIIVEDDVS